MSLEWCATIVGQMRQNRINGKKLAELTGYSYQYISQLLNGRKATSRARDRIEAAIASVSDKIED